MSNNRRLFLKSLGITIALPYMESIVGAVPYANAQVASSRRKKFVAMFFPNGALALSGSHPGNGNWVYGAGGALNELAAAGLRQNTITVRGLQHISRFDQHLTGTSSMLSAVQPVTGRTGGAFNLRNSTSIDQVIADHLHQTSPTQFRSIHTGYRYMGHPAFTSSAHQHYINTISWRNATTPNMPTYSPVSVFDRLFFNNPGRPGQPSLADYVRQRKKSVLDYVGDQSQSLKGKMSRKDQIKFDRFLASVRDVEKKIADGPVNEVNTCGPGGADPRTRFERIADYVDHMNKMVELTVVALSCDLTNVATLMVSNGTGDIWRDHHSMAHGSVGGRTREVSEMREINLIQIRFYRDLLTRLKSAGILKDTLTVYGSNMGNGVHLNYNIPFLIGTEGPGYRLGQELGSTNEVKPQGGILSSLLKAYGINQAVGEGVNRGNGSEYNIFT